MFITINAKALPGIMIVDLNSNFLVKITRCGSGHTYGIEYHIMQAEMGSLFEEFSTQEERDTRYNQILELLNK